MTRTRILFVCLGNICRSPMAQGAFEHMAAQQGLSECFEADSAGTAGWHIGKPPDPRGIAAAASRGIDLSHQRARRLEAKDFEDFDHILVMDKSNRDDVVSKAPDGRREKVSLFLQGTNVDTLEVPDPYYGGDDGFDDVLDLIEDGVRSLLDRLT